MDTVLDIVIKFYIIVIHCHLETVISQQIRTLNTSQHHDLHPSIALHHINRLTAASTIDPLNKQTLHHDLHPSLLPLHRSIRSFAKQWPYRLLVASIVPSIAPWSIAYIIQRWFPDPLHVSYKNNPKIILFVSLLYNIISIYQRVIGGAMDDASGA